MKLNEISEYFYSPWGLLGYSHVHNNQIEGLLEKLKENGWR